jgi:hypothetical protein
MATLERICCASTSRERGTTIEPPDLLCMFVITVLQPSDIDLEVQRSVSPRIAFLRSAVAESFPWSAVQFRSDPIAVVLGEVGHALAFGEILAEQAIGVFVGAWR